MEQQTVTIEVAIRTAQILAALSKRAESLGVPLESLLLPLIPADEELEEVNGHIMRPEDRANDFVQWLKEHSVKGIVADDSRESIYTREDESF
jgi:hypothetical protein